LDAAEQEGIVKTARRGRTLMRSAPPIQTAQASFSANGAAIPRFSAATM
jgi:hypothetical protein